MANKRALSREEKYTQSFLFIADALAGFAASGKNVIALCTTSDIFYQICATAKERGIDCKCLDLCAKDSHAAPPPEQYGKYISEARKKHALILTNILPPQEYADSLKLAKLTDGILLFEKYGKARYADFENCIAVLKNNEVPILGIVGVK